MDDQGTSRESGCLDGDESIYLAALREHQGKWIPSTPDIAAKLEYHVFADAVYWSDEFPRLMPSKLEDAFRLVINHRTSLLLGKQGRFAWAWDLAEECYPDWPGFLSDRCSPNPELADRIRRIRRVSKRKIKRFEEWAEKDFPTS